MVSLAKKGRQANRRKARINLLSRIPGERYSAVKRIWEGRTCAIFGGGPSLTQEQVDLCRGLPCIAVNDTYLLAPWATALYAADNRWFDWHAKGIARIGLTAEQVMERFESFAGERITIYPSCDKIADERVHWLKSSTASGHDSILSEDPGVLVTGANSGYQAMGVAYLAGAKRILLLGFDAKERGKDTHWFGDHPVPTSKSWLSGLPYQIQRIGDALKAKGVEVINCSPDSAISCFEKMSVEDALSVALA